MSDSNVALSEEQRAGLWRTKLRALARDSFDRADGVDHPAPWGAALETNGAWTALLEVSPERTFGQALVLAARHDAASLDLIAEQDSGDLARRAGLFDPAPLVWQLDGAELTQATPTQPEQVVAPDLEPAVAELLAVAEVTVLAEHGSIIGECRGLEVARVSGAGADQRLDVGVGAYDQGAFAVINPDMTPIEALAEVVAQVLTHRHKSALTHPLNRLARERWIRSELVADPTLIGLRTLDIVEPMRPRDGIKDVAIASAIGVDDAGATVLVACTVGIDLDAVPAAADLAERHHADRIIMVLPDRDRHPLVQAVAAQSRRPVEFVSAPEPWPT